MDSYSAFWDNGKLSQTDLLLNLLSNDITKVFVCGLAYDYCVGSTAEDAAQHGFQTYVIRDGARGVADESMKQMDTRLNRAGVKCIQSENIKDLLNS